MQRLKDERGAVAVIVAILMTALLGLTAIAVDISAMWSEKRQLQNGADAGALAIAQACAKGACGTPSATAQSFATLNKNDGWATGTVVSLTSSQVTVRASDSHENWFAKIFGSNQTGVSADATVKWGWPVKGGTFPLTFSICEWNAQAGGPDSTVEHTIVLTKTSTTMCTGPSGNAVPGGFGWVKPDPGGCSAVSYINTILHSDTGNTPPSACSPSNFDALLGTTVLIPIFDQATGTGNNADYRVYGYAAFKFTGYYFGGQYKSSPQPCSGNVRCIKGYFTRYVDLNEVLEIGPGAPQLGASIITLVD